MLFIFMMTLQDKFEKFLAKVFADLILSSELLFLDNESFEMWING